MTLWDLPGPRRFVESCRKSLASGSNLVVSFPGAIPEGFDDALISALGNSLYSESIAVTDSPLKDLAAAFADSPDTIHSLSDMLVQEKFAGLLVWLDGLDEGNWPAWREALEDHAEMIRGTSLLGRSLFCAPLPRGSVANPARSDVTLANHEWDGVVDEIDLMLLASERLRSQERSPLVRLFLATSVARVAAWDFDTASRLLDSGPAAMLAPLETLKSIAAEKGWTSDTPLAPESGTVSQQGVTHPVRAAVEDPAREIERRIWSAQVSVLMPRIEERRHATVERNLYEIRYRMRRADMNDSDPHGMELGELLSLLQAPGVPRALRNSVARLRNHRNRLAHLAPLDPDSARRLLESDNLSRD